MLRRRHRSCDLTRTPVHTLELCRTHPRVLCTYRTRAKIDAWHVKLFGSRTDKNRMAVHVICPSLRCRKILTVTDDVRGSNVTCRYCQMKFRVPYIRRPVESPRVTTPGLTTAAPPAK